MWLLVGVNLENWTSNRGLLRYIILQAYTSSINDLTVKIHPIFHPVSFTVWIKKGIFVFSSFCAEVFLYFRICQVPIDREKSSWIVIQEKLQLERTTPFSWLLADLSTPPHPPNLSRTLHYSKSPLSRPHFFPVSGGFATSNRRERGRAPSSLVLGV